jgi:hypothetical protein
MSAKRAQAMLPGEKARVLAMVTSTSVASNALAVRIAVPRSKVLQRRRFSSRAIYA